MIVPHFFSTYSMLLLLTKTTPIQSFTFYKEFFLARYTRNKWWNKRSRTLHIASSLFSIFHEVTSQVGFAEFNNTADNRANIGGTIIGAPIVGQ